MGNTLFSGTMKYLSSIKQSNKVDDIVRCIPGVQVSIGHVLPGLCGDVSDGVDLLLGVINNKVVITPVIRES